MPYSLSFLEHAMPSTLLFHRICIVLAGVVLAVSTTGCERRKSAPVTADAAAQHGAMTRAEFNFRAAERFLPLFWREDANSNGIIEPGELAILTGYGRAGVWVDSAGAFTPAFEQAYGQMAQPDPVPSDDNERQRHELVVEELRQGRPTLVETDLIEATPAEKNLLDHLIKAAQAIERLYARQKGVFGMDASIPESDTASRMLFYRNQSPWCEAPRTENEPHCSALAMKPPHIVGLYPAQAQSDADFCGALSEAPNMAELTGHFSVVVDADRQGRYRAVPYTQAYAADMQVVAQELEAAAVGLGEQEAALRTYLQAAAASFRSNDWTPADAAWVAMNAHNSQWYVRVAPDEVYYDPCAWKAGFALQLARINPESIEWQNKLDPLKDEMEKTIAAMAKAPYLARKVNFRIPDFIDVVLNAGDQRNAHGATIGQSLPNWGPVAASGGRTVAMTNLYTDADSRGQQEQLMSSVFCTVTNEKTTTGPRESLISSLLHEAAHNLGPAHDYEVRGQQDDAVFGGTLASTLEELKAQTSSMFLTQWLAGKGVFSHDEVQRIQLRNIAWAFGHISRGMYTADGTPRNYSQLAAIQVGALMEAGAMHWHKERMAANGADRGCLEIDFEALPPAVEALETQVLEIKASGDKARAEALKAQFVDADDAFSIIKSAVTERWLRAPKASFVYSLRR